ncbi:(R)-stereoselective amidase [Gimesia alba]|uniref:(R)-stereoselective amidase n=1 Tax=Gimesia alba TaxID=2527973 RepID=A0A517RHV6_9PLAN|nr:nitrilase family protein [Gimesia alba]QDT43440.1 (R)-stereoselective amidase [Gimesia alba]
MRDIRIAAVQFEHRNGDKAYNLQRIRELAHQAVEQGAEIVSFHECCIPAYTFVQSFSKEQLIDLAEPVPNGPSTQELMQISEEVGVPILAGLFEVDQGEVYNTYICVDGTELLARFRKLHAFVNSHLSSGDEYVVFDVRGCRCGILICYDNNLVENVRMTAMLGADIIFMPHVTCCLPSVMPGRGLVDPARAYDNGVYAIFTNPVGIDDQEVKPGLSMILDPFGEIIGECTKLGDDITIALCTEEKLGQAGGRRYIRARRPDLYGKLVEPSETPPVTEPGWELKPSS